MMVATGVNAYAKEMAIRKRIGSIYNKREEDFPSLKDYNDYLEEVEDMTFNLIEGIDVADIEAKIAKYQEENAEQIINSRARKAEELAAALRASRGNLMQAEVNDVSSQAYSQQGQYAPAALQPRPSGLAPQPVPVGGGSHCSLQGFGADDEETLKLYAERGARAGGWTQEISRKRALEEAFSTIWI